MTLSGRQTEDGSDITYWAFSETFSSPASFSDLTCESGSGSSCSSEATEVLYSCFYHFFVNSDGYDVTDSVPYLYEDSADSGGITCDLIFRVDNATMYEYAQAIALSSGTNHYNEVSTITDVATAAAAAMQKYNSAIVCFVLQVNVPSNGINALNFGPLVILLSSDREFWDFEGMNSEGSYLDPCVIPGE